MISPYLIKVRGVPSLYNPNNVMDLTTIILQNKDNAMCENSKLIVYRDNIMLLFSPTHTDTGRACYMNGLGRILINRSVLPETEITNLHRSLFLSYFGNGAKKKLENFKTYAELHKWVTSCQWEVMELMGFDLTYLTLRPVPQVLVTAENLA